jgi:hypothetical protein
MAETKFGKYIITQTPENPMHPRVKYGTPLYNTLWINNQLNGAIPGAFFLECSLISQKSEIQEPTGKPHNHDFDEYLVWLGTNPDNPFDLDAEIELWLENERHIITKTTAVFIPKGMYHLPLIYRKVERPILIVVIGNTFRYRHLSYSNDPEWAKFELPKEAVEFDKFLDSLYRESPQ